MIRNILKIIATLFVGYLLGIVFGIIFGIFLGGIPSLLFREIAYANQTILMSITVSLVLGALLGFFAVLLANKSFAASDKPLIGILLGLAVSSIIVFILGGVIDISAPDLVNRPMYIIPIIYCGRVGSYIGGIIFPMIGATRVIRDIFSHNTEARSDENRLDEFQKFLGRNS